MYTQHRRTPAPCRQEPRDHISPSVLTAEPEPELVLQPHPQPGTWFRPWLWPAEPETLGDAGTSTFPKLGVSHVGKSTELTAAALWDLGPGLLGLEEGLVGLCSRAHGLGVVGLHLLQALLVVLLGTAHVPQELRVCPLKRFESL